MSNQAFTFFKDNRVDQEFTLTEEQLREHYKTYLETKERQWVEYYWRQIDGIFVMEHLEAVSESDEREELSEKLEAIRNELWKELTSN